MTAADQPATEPSAEQVKAAARTLNLNGWTCDGGSDEPGNYDDCEGCQRCCDGLARAALRSAAELGRWGRRITSAPAPQPAADAEPVQRATELLVQHQATSDSGCICGGVPLGRSHPEHAARVLDDVGFLHSTRDSRIDAWQRVAEHPVFASSYAEGVPLIDSMLRRLDALD